MLPSHMNSPIAEYFPSPTEDAPLDDDTLFWELFLGEPIAEDGHVTLTERPGLGIELNRERIREWAVS